MHDRRRMIRDAVKQFIRDESAKPFRMTLSWFVAFLCCIGYGLEKYFGLHDLCIAVLFYAYAIHFLLPLLKPGFSTLVSLKRMEWFALIACILFAIFEFCLLFDSMLSEKNDRRHNQAIIVSYTPIRRNRFNI